MCNNKWICKKCKKVFIYTPQTTRYRIKLHIENKHDYMISEKELNNEIFKTTKTNESEGQYNE